MTSTLPPTASAMNDRLAAVEAWENFFRAQVSVMRALHEEFPRGELSFQDYDVLFTLAQQPDHCLRLRDINKRVLLTQPSVSRLIDRLTARGFVTKCSEEKDGRGVLVTLTEYGYEVFVRAARVHSKTVADYLGSRLTPDELTALTTVSHKLIT